MKWLHLGGSGGAFAGGAGVGEAVAAGAGLDDVSAEGEAYGLDLHEHGISAYPEYVISAMGRPAGMVHRELDKPGKEAPAHFSAIEPTT